MTTTKPDNGGGSTSQTGYIKGNDVRLRSGAGTNYSILGSYNNGTPLTITGTSGNWTAVTINGVKGYVNSAYVTTTKSDGGSKPSGSIGETIVATAKQYMGAPYVYGGMSPSGFDCSGFVNYVYKLCGYSMSRVASSIYNNNGKDIALVQRLLQHSSPATTQRYIGIEPERIERLNAILQCQLKKILA